MPFSSFTPKNIPKGLGQGHEKGEKHVNKASVLFIVLVMTGLPWFWFLAVTPEPEMLKTSGSVQNAHITFAHDMHMIRSIRITFALWASAWCQNIRFRKYRSFRALSLLAKSSIFASMVIVSFVCVFIFLFVCPHDTGRTAWDIISIFFVQVHIPHRTKPIDFGRNRSKVKVRKKCRKSKNSLSLTLGRNFKNSYLR